MEIRAGQSSTKWCPDFEAEWVVQIGMSLKTEGLPLASLIFPVNLKTVLSLHKPMWPEAKITGSCDTREAKCLDWEDGLA